MSSNLSHSDSEKLQVERTNEYSRQTNEGAMTVPKVSSASFSNSKDSVLKLRADCRATAGKPSVRILPGGEVSFRADVEGALAVVDRAAARTAATRLPKERIIAF